MAGTKKEDGFTKEERAAMRAAAAERKRAAKGADLEADLVAAIAALDEPDRGTAERLHALIKREAPELGAKTWYGMPAWTLDDKVFCHFQSAQKFGTRYATIGFSDKAQLDDGAMWPVGFALTALGAAEQARITELLKKALGRG